MGLVLAAFCVPGLGQSQDRFALSARQVAQTLSEKGMQIDGDQVSLLANVVATEPNPVLDIFSVEPLGDQPPGEQSGTHVWVRVACHEPNICLPFYAAVTLPKETAGGTSNIANVSSAIRKAALKPNAVITMRAGAHATLMMDDDRSHIQIAVISLESGIAGHRIRVASPDHKRVFVAEVISAHLLRRSF